MRYKVQGVERVSSLPAASAAFRGVLLLVPGGAGVADVLYCCVKLADNSYSWETVTLT